MNEQKRDMTGAWALNALDADERALLEEHLAQDPDAAAEARSFEETAAELAGGLEPQAPRPELKSALMARIARTPQLPAQNEAEVEVEVEETPVNGDAGERGDADVIPLDRYRSSVRRSRWLAVAAAALMVTSIAGVALWGSERAAREDDRATIEALESAQAGSDQERAMISTLLTAEDTSQVTVPAEHGGSLHVMFSRDQQSMVVHATGLPELPSGSTYQLWIVDDTATSAGLLSETDQTVMASAEMSPTAQIGLSIEPAGGSAEPTDVIGIQEL